MEPLFAGFCGGVTDYRWVIPGGWNTESMIMMLHVEIQSRLPPNDANPQEYPRGGMDGEPFNFRGISTRLVINNAFLFWWFREFDDESDYPDPQSYVWLNSLVPRPNWASVMRSQYMAELNAAEQREEEEEADEDVDDETYYEGEDHGWDDEMYYNEDDDDHHDANYEYLNANEE